LDRKHGLTTPRWVLELRYGQNTPAIAVAVPAKDAFDYYAGFAKRENIRNQDPEGKEIFMALQDCTRSMDVRHVTIQPAMSNLKENTLPKKISSAEATPTIPAPANIVSNGVSLKPSEAMAEHGKAAPAP
jgi:hypothetical protein